MTKLEWRKTEKALYLPKASPGLVEVGEQKFFMIEGKGDPASPDFAARIGVLYTLAYAVRMMPKSGHTPVGYVEYAVYPLEGVWSGAVTDRDSFEYTLMIRQPEFVTADVVERAFSAAARKAPTDLIDKARFAAYTDGLSVQMLHVGPYDDESRSFAAMDAFVCASGLERVDSRHREIYLSDPGRTAPAALKTTLRYRVRRMNQEQ